MHEDALAMQERALEFMQQPQEDEEERQLRAAIDLSRQEQERSLEFMQQPQEDEEERQLRAAIDLSRQEQERSLELYGFAKGVVYFFISIKKCQLSPSRNFSCSIVQLL
jgi:hypothetical protein